MVKLLLRFGGANGGPSLAAARPTVVKTLSRVSGTLLNSLSKRCAGCKLGLRVCAVARLGVW